MSNLRRYLRALEKVKYYEKRVAEFEEMEVIKLMFPEVHASGVVAKTFFDKARYFQLCDSHKRDKELLRYWSGRAKTKNVGPGGLG